MTKQHNSTTLLRLVRPPAREPAASGFGARLRAALAGLIAFFAKPAAARVAEKTVPPARPSRAPRAASSKRVTQRKHLRVVHTGTRI